MFFVVGPFSGLGIFLAPKGNRKEGKRFPKWSLGDISGRRQTLVFNLREAYGKVLETLLEGTFRRLRSGRLPGGVPRDNFTGILLWLLCPTVCGSQKRVETKRCQNGGGWQLGFTPSRLRILLRIFSNPLPSPINDNGGNRNNPYRCCMCLGLFCILCKCTCDACI